MKTIKFILVTAIIICSSALCYAQSSKKIGNKEFQILLDRFKTVTPPLNYKKIRQRIFSMTKEEAIQFLHKTEEELYYIEEDYDVETNERTYHREEHTAGCAFKYQLNDSIYILCTRESNPNIAEYLTWVNLRTFTLKGTIIDKCTVGEKFTSEKDCVSFVLLDKTHIRVFYYEDNNAREKEGYRTTVYYKNYEITGDGKFIEKDKSDVTWLKDWAVKYSTYKPKSDDPMNEYNF
jgi:hypothetical protein